MEANSTNVYLDADGGNDTRTEVFLNVEDKKTGEKKVRKIDIDKVTKGLEKGTQVVTAGGGLINSIKDIFGRPTQPIPATVVDVATTEPEKEKMSTTTKVIIGVAAVAVLGGIIYMVAKK